MVRSSTGVQQGCSLANPLFALVMKYIMDKLSSAGLEVKMCFWDDCVLVGSAAAAGAAARIIQDLECETGLSLKWDKCHVHAPSEVIARDCESLFPDDVQLHDTMNMNWMRVPIGSDEFVDTQLKSKLAALKETVDRVADMPYKHEAFTLKGYVRPSVE